MKRKFLIIVFVFALALSWNKPSEAQDFNFTRAYQDYLYSQNAYSQAYSSYQDAKDFYLKSPTLTLKEDARKKTLAMLRARDQLEAVYLTALRIKIVETKGLSGDEKNNIFGKIDPEVKWYQDHAKEYQDGDSLEALFSKSAGVEEHYKATTLPNIYESLFDISLGFEVGVRQDQEQIYSDLKKIVDSGVSSGSLKMDPFNRWFTDIDGLIGVLKQNDETSKTQIQKIYGQYFSLQGSYNTATDTLSDSLVSLKKLNGFLTGVLASI